MNLRKSLIWILPLMPASAVASEGLDSGDTAWMLTSTALVLFMTLPGMLATIAWCGLDTFVLLKVVNAIVPLRVTDEQETEGLDLVLHEERGYDI